MCSWNWIGLNKIDPVVDSPILERLDHEFKMYKKELLL